MRQPILFLCKLLLIILLVYGTAYALLRQLSPDPGLALSGLYTDAATRAYVIDALDLDKPYFVALANQIGRLARADFGVSLRTQRPVLSEIAHPLHLTFSLAAFVALLATLCTVAGFLAGLRHEITMKDSLMFFTSSASAFPGFLVALLLAPLFPVTQGGPFFSLWSLQALLPVVALTLPLMPYAVSTGVCLAQDMRKLPWFETFTAFGFTPLTIAWMHGQRWLLRGFCNVSITTFLMAFTGSVAVELVCGMPGLGVTMLDAIDTRDLPVVLAISGLTATFSGVLVLVREELSRGEI